MPEYIHDPQERLIARVKALLALAQDKGATPAEAAKAAEMASRLALKHSIDLSNLNTKEQPEQYKPAPVTGATEGYKAWKSNLVAGLCLVNGCFAFTVSWPGGLCAYMVSGPKHAQAVIGLTMDYLEKALARLHREALAMLRAQGNSPSNPKAFRRAFYPQAAREMYARFKKKRDDLQAQTSPIVDPEKAPSNAPRIGQGSPNTAGALVPLGFFEQQEQRAREAAGAGQMKSRTIPQSRNASGRVMGAIAGRKVGLDIQVGGTNTNPNRITKE